MTSRGRGLIADVVVGGMLGGVVGAVVAVNVVIFSVIDGGYEASIPQVFGLIPVVGVITVAILAAGPIAGVVLARRRRLTDEGDPRRRGEGGGS